MHIGEKELNRLISYAEGLGLIVIWKGVKELETPAQLVFTEPPTIELKKYKRVSYKQLILDMLHELGHYHDWINNGRRTPSEVFAKNHSELTKSEREIVYKDEKKATLIATSLAKHLDLKYPKLELVRANSAYDRWYYKRFYITGKEPSPKDRIEKYNKIKQKYGIN